MSTDTIPITSKGTSNSDGKRKSHDPLMMMMMTTTTTPSTFEKYITLTHKALQKSRSSLDTKALIEMAYGEDALVVYGGSDMLVGILDDVLDKIVNESIPLYFVDNYCHRRQQLQRNDNKGGGKNDEMLDRTYANDYSSDDTKDLELAIMSPKQRLDYVDKIVQHVIEWEERRAHVEAIDVASARTSLDQTLLLPSSSSTTTMKHGGEDGMIRNNSHAPPQQLQTMDVVRYREHQQRIVVKRKFLEELQRVENEIASLQQRQVFQHTNVQSRFEVVQKVESELEAAANLLVTVPW
jgi:hypothetical protein